MDDLRLSGQRITLGSSNRRADFQPDLPQQSQRYTLCAQWNSADRAENAFGRDPVSAPERYAGAMAAFAGDPRADVSAFTRPPAVQSKQQLWPGVAHVRVVGLPGESEPERLH